MSASQLLDHWLSDHAGSSPGSETAETSVTSAPRHVNCQMEASNLPALLSSLQPSQPPESPPRPGTSGLLHQVLLSAARVRNIVELVKFVLERGQETAASHAPDPGTGDTPLTLVRGLLDTQRFEEAKEVAELLLESGADPEHRNSAGWSALSYSLVHQDASLNLTRSLLHHGSAIIPPEDASPPSQSCLPLRVLLRSVIRAQSVSGARGTLQLVGQVLGVTAEPRLMREHVLAAILAEGSLLTANGGEVCAEVRATLAAYWTQPKPLLHLSLQASRKRLGLKRLHSGNLQAMLIAPRIQHYLSYQSTLPMICSQTQTTGTEKTDKNISHLRHESLTEKFKIRLLQYSTPTAYKRK